MINQQPNNNISSLALSSQNALQGYKDVFYQLEQAIGAEAQNVNLLMQKGIITQPQGQYLLSQLTNKAQQINMYKNLQNQHLKQVAAAPVQSLQTPQQPENPMAMFDKERPGFFEEEGRGDVRDYLKGCEMDKDEILRIASLVEGLENSAVEKYLKKSAHDKSLNDENELAKKKLTAYAQNSSANSKNNRIFTREEIGKMSGEEFAKNEKIIMDQVKQGLIK